MPSQPTPEKRRPISRPLANRLAPTLAPKLARACWPVVESLEARQFLSASTIQTLPFNLDFTADRGEVVDKDGQGTGFTLVQPNKLGTQYQPSLIDLDTTNGVLKLTTTGSSTAGSNTNNDNTLANGLETLFNATTSGFKITVRLKGPLNSIAAPSDQAGVMFGPDQDNFIKLVAISQPSGQVVQFSDEESTNGTTFTHQVSLNQAVGTAFSSITTLDLQLVGDASTGTVSAQYSVNGGSYSKLSKTVTLTGAAKSNFFNTAGTAGIIALQKNDNAPVTMAFDNFRIDAGQPIGAHPSIIASRPTNGDVGVSRDAYAAADLKLTSPGAPVDVSTLTSVNVKLYRASDKLPITTILNLSGNGDALTATPTSLLDPNTTYTFQITAGLKDTSGATFTPYQMSFTTGSTGGAGNPSIAFEKVALSAATGQNYTSMAIGPDGKLYASTDTGLIQRFTINPDGTLGTAENITSFQTAEGNRWITGLVFDPQSNANNMLIWVASTDPATNNASDFTTRITKIYGSSLQVVQDAVINLPRASHDRSSNQLAFGPDGGLYFAIDSMTDMGDPDNATGLRSEHLLSGAVLRLNTAAIGITDPAIDAKTDSGGTYNPFASGAPLTIYATGIRSGFDLVWTSDGKLYVPTTGAVAGGNTPSTPTAPYSFGANQRIDFTTNGAYTGPDVLGVPNDLETQPDLLLNVTQGGYYGQPNPTRGEFVLNGGNPSTGIDPNEVAGYAVGTFPDRNYQAPAYSFGDSAIPAGAIEYHGSIFGSALNNKILVTRSGGGNDIIVLTRAGNGTISSAQSGIAGLTGFNNPVDLIEDPNTGFMYVAEDGGQKLTLIRAIGTGANITTDKTQMVFNDPTSSGASPGNKITITNTGTSALNISALTITGTDAAKFSITAKPTLPATVAPGASVTVTIAYTASAIGINTATLNIASNDSDHATTTIALRGLGTAGQGGNNEPSLQRIFDLYQIPDNVGDSNPSDVFLDNPPTTPNDEIVASTLTKAGSGPITIQPIAVFGVGSSTSPTVNMGYYTPGNRDDLNQLLSLTGTGNVTQTVNPAMTGTFSFDPGSSAFGLYGNFVSMYPTVYNVPGGTYAYSEDRLNAAYDPNSPRKVRFYPLKNSDGSVVPNAYIFAMEDYLAGYDNQDMVGIIRNVTPAAPGPEIGFQNLDGDPFTDRMVFNRVQIEPPSPEDANGLPDYQPPNNVTHDSAILRLTNSGTQSLNITSITVPSGWTIDNLPTMPFSIGAGSTMDLTIRFVATGTSGGKIVSGTLVIKSNDADEPTSNIQLEGWWQNKSENPEPTVAQLTQILGYGTTITKPGQAINTGGATVAVGDEVLSGLWKRQNTGAPVTLREIASWHTQGNTATASYYTVNSSGTATTNKLFTMEGTEGQSFLPHVSGSLTNPAFNSFSPSGNFGFRVDSEWSEDSRNAIPAGSTTDTGHHMRFFVAKDENGNIIPGEYLMVMDYAGINYDYNDNMYLVTNIKPLTAPSKPTGITANPGGAGTQLDWSDSTAPNLAGYNVYRSDAVDGTFTKINQILLSTSDFNDVSAPVGTTAFYQITAVDLDGNESAPGTISAVRPTDTTPPSTPSNLIATGSQSGISLQWSNNLDADLAGYNVYRSDSFSGAYTLLNTGGLLTSSTYLDSTAPTNATSYYRVTAVDTSGNESAANVANAARPSGDTTPPASPSNVVATPSTADVALNWNDNTESDFAGYNVYRASSQFGTYTKLNTTLLTTSDFDDTTATAGTTSWYHVTAVDTHNNESIATTVSSVRTPDTTPPAAPTGATATADTTGITLDWADSPESDLGGYNVYSSTSPTGTFTKLNTSLLAVSGYLDTTPAQGVPTYYRITAVDSSGNESTHTDVNATRPDSVPPAAPAHLTVVAGFSAIALDWDDNTEPDLAGYNVYRSTAVDGIFNKINTTPLTASQFQDASAPAGATSFYHVTAVDQFGNESTATATSAFRPDLGLNGNANDIVYDSTGVLHFAYYDDVALNVKYASRDTNGNWSAVTTIDTSGDDVGGWLSIAVDSQNRPAVAYFDGTRGDLRYAILTSGTWDVQTVDSKQSVGLFPSLKFDATDHPTIAYYKKTTGDLRVAVNDGTNWNITSVATPDDVGRSASLAKQANGLWAIAYENSTAGRLQYAYQTNATTWQNVTVDTSTAGMSYISLAFDTSGRANISYQETGLGDLKFAVLKNNKWTTTTVASKGAVGMYTKLVFSADGFANIFYYSKQLNTLMQAKGYLGNWTINTLHTAGGRFISGVLGPDNKITYVWLDAASQVLTLDELA